MYTLGSATAFTGFAVAGDATGLFKQLGLVGPVLSVMHFAVGVLLAIWLVAFLYALAVITLRRLGRAAPVPVPVPVRPVALARRSAS